MAHAADSYPKPEEVSNGLAHEDEKLTALGVGSLKSFEKGNLDDASPKTAKSEIPSCIHSTRPISDLEIPRNRRSKLRRHRQCAEGRRAHSVASKPRSKGGAPTEVWWSGATNPQVAATGAPAKAERTQ